MIAGRAALDSRWAATAVSSGRGGSSSGVASIAVTTGRVVSASSTSCGISTHTGPCGAVSADFQAAAIADGIWDWRTDRVDGLHHAPERGGLVGEFVQVAVAAAAEPGGRDLAADRQDGGGGRRRLLERGQRGQRARAGGQEQRGRLAGDPAVRVRREARVVLHPQADVPQVGAAQRVEHAERVLAGQAEDGGRAEPGQRLHDQVSAVAAGRAGSARPPSGRRSGGAPGRGRGSLRSRPFAARSGGT